MNLSSIIFKNDILLYIIFEINLWQSHRFISNNYLLYIIYIYIYTIQDEIWKKYFIKSP